MVRTIMAFQSGEYYFNIVVKKQHVTFSENHRTSSHDVFVNHRRKMREIMEHETRDMTMNEKARNKSSQRESIK